MNRALTILLCLVALLASGLAIAAGTNASVALPVAAVAVGAGALLLVEVVGRTRWPPGRPLPALPADPARVRSSLRAGEYGRPALVLLLDNLERSGGNPHRPNTSLDELARLRALSPEEFRRYLTARVNELERQTT
jgi:hypothetical protein